MGIPVRANHHWVGARHEHNAVITTARWGKAFGWWSAGKQAAEIPESATRCPFHTKDIRKASKSHQMGPNVRNHLIPKTSSTPDSGITNRLARKENVSACSNTCSQRPKLGKRSPLATATWRPVRPNLVKASSEEIDLLRIKDVVRSSEEGLKIIDEILKVPTVLFEVRQFTQGVDAARGAKAKSTSRLELGP
nr:hypothetical protein C2845_PM13G11350 [Ipomoea batatas]